MTVTVTPLKCPSCGAPLPKGSVNRGTCEYCGTGYLISGSSVEPVKEDMNGWRFRTFNEINEGRMISTSAESHEELWTKINDQIENEEERRRLFRLMFPAIAIMGVVVGIVILAWLLI